MVAISSCHVKVLSVMLKVIVTLLIAIVPATTRAAESLLGSLSSFESRVFVVFVLISAALWDPTLGVLLTILYVTMLLQAHASAMKALYDTYGAEKREPQPRQPPGALVPSPLSPYPKDELDDSDSEDGDEVALIPLPSGVSVGQSWAGAAAIP